MEKNQFSESNLIRRQMLKFIIALIFIFAIISIRQVIMQHAINHEKYNSNVVNVSGRQRMLSQKIGKDVLALYLYSDEKSINYYQNELEDDVQLWETSYDKLVNGKVGGDSEVTDSEVIKQMYADIKGNYEAILTAAKDILTLVHNGNYNKDNLYQKIKIIQENDPGFLEGMDHIVQQYDKESVQKIAVLNRIEIALFILLLISFLFVFFFIYLPGSRNLSESYKNILFLSYHDRLTGLYNRYYFERKVIEETELSGTCQEHASLIIFDIDHFKHVNDTWGHPVGDEVLTLIADTVAKDVRKTDVFARLGGEEFIVLLPNTDLHEAGLVAEKLRKAIEESSHPVAGTVTCSFGVAERNENETYNKWYQRVDEALYQAKNNGRNRVTIVEFPIVKNTALLQIEWRNEWDCANETLNEQHRELLEIGSSLINVSLSVKTDAEKKECVNLLIESLRKHFSYEESVLKKAAYPDLDAHICKHAELLEKADMMNESYSKGELKATAFFTYLIEDVINGHLLEEDMKFFPYLKKD